MSVPFTEFTPAVLVTVFLASLAGSIHCVGMCGGLVASVAQTRGAVLRYHVARLIGYCSLGALAGFAGQSFFQSTANLWLSWMATLVLGAGFIVMGVRIWRGSGMHMRWVPNHLLMRLYQGAKNDPFRVGLLSVFLPCGWLHTYVLGATLTGSVALGALFLFVFWVGTLPALAAAPLVLTRLLKPAVRYSPRLTATLLIVAGGLSVATKLGASKSWIQSGKVEQTADCHGP